jgi:histidine triad (HIT) family protein
MTQETLFTKIINKKIPADILFQDDDVTVFRDIAPIAPQHILIIPNKPIPTVNDVTAEDQMVLGKLFITAAKMAMELGIDKSGYRLLVNCNDDGGQEIYHIHMHLLGGEPIGPMRVRK